MDLDLLEEMCEKYKLSDEEHNRIGNNINEIMLEGKTPSKNPIAIIDIAPPGSGKTGLNGYALKQFENENLIIVNNDEFKPFHPKADELARLYPEYYIKVTNEESKRWTDDLMDIAIEGRYNVLYEGTGRKIEIFKRMIAKMQGYRIIVRVMAVNELNCLMSILERYEGQVKEKGWGRIVSVGTFYKAYDEQFYEIISFGILNDRILIGDFVKRSHVNVDKKMCYIKTEGNDHDVYVMVHEMAHYVNAILGQKFIDRNNVIYTEVFSYYMERQLDKFLLEKGYHQLVFTRYQNRTHSTCETARSLKNFLDLKRIYETNKFALLFEKDRITKLLRCDRNYPAQFYLRYLIGTIYSRRLALEESDRPFISRINSLNLDDEISKFRRENLTFILK